MAKLLPNRIIREADGTLLCPECGCPLSDIRSNEHLRAFFAFIKFCFDNWPEQSTFTPDNPEHLRAYLLVLANHRQPHHVFRFANKRELQIVEGFVTEEMRVDRARGVYGWPVQRDGGLAILRPASIAFGAISQKRFNEISEAVFKAIYEIARIDFNNWKEGLLAHPERRLA